ncbi:MAG: CPBP family intramembrane metalloprotease [Deltaproteobacteria bacterium]|nr:CPBP family intramembrane metalloprotease [Deltaproteobacteria bacterium]
MTNLKPLGWTGSLLLFGIPAAVFTLFLFWVLPAVAAAGTDPLLTFHAGFVAPLALMLIAAFVAYRLEGRPWTWAGIRERFRLERPDGRTWAWTAALVALAVVLLPVFPVTAWIQGLLANVPLYDPPQGYSSFMSGLSDGQTHIFGRPFTWGLFVYFVSGLFVFNILGEELWWRGYILPRQELAFGAKTWLIHGFGWALFHIFYHYTLGIFLSYLPITLATSFVAQRTRNTWPGIIAHMVSNLGIPLLMLSRLLA